MNNYYSITAPAKLNLNLLVRGKDNKGLHLLNSDVCFLELADRIYFEFSENDTFLQTNTNKSLLINSLSLFSHDIFDLEYAVKGLSSSSSFLGRAADAP